MVNNEKGKGKGPEPDPRGVQPPGKRGFFLCFADLVTGLKPGRLPAVPVAKYVARRSFLAFVPAVCPPRGPALMALPGSDPGSLLKQNKIQ